MNEWIKTESSFIKAISLDEQSRVIGVSVKGQELFFEIRNPNINIQSLFRSFLNAPSKGTFLNKVLMKNKLLLQ